MKKRIYRRVSVKDVRVERLVEQFGSATVVLAIDVAKQDMVAALGNERGEVVTTIAWTHPRESEEFLALVSALKKSAKAVQAVMEPSGTYGDALRYQLKERGVTTYRVGSKRTHDAAELYDSVPSMHDAKSAAILLRLHAQGLSTPWVESDEQTRELKAALSTMELYHEHYLRNLNVLESVLSRHWPELPDALELTSASLLVLLAKVGGPQQVAAAPEQARQMLRAASRGLMRGERIEQAIGSAASTVGEPMLACELAMLQELAEELHRALRSYKHAKLRVEELSASETLEPMAAVVGKVTASVLVVDVGHPRDMSCAHAFVKALGLNLKERSSGKHHGKLSLSKRGSSRARKYLWFAVLRWLQKDPIVAAWYRSKVARDGGTKMKALGALMRKLAKALYHVARGEALDSRKLFDVSRLPTSA